MPLKALAEMGVDGLSLIAIAYGILFLVCLPVGLKRLSFVRGNIKPLLLILMFGGMANACFNYAFIHGEVLRVMALFYLLPVWGVLGGWLFLKEKASLWRWAGVVLAISGALILLDVRKFLAQPFNVVDLVALFSGLFFAATILLFRTVEQVPLSIKLNSLFLGCSLIAVLVSSIIFFNNPPANSGPSSIVSIPSLSVFLWVVAFALGWLLWSSLGVQWAVTILPAGRSSIIMVMELVAAGVSAVFAGGEVFTQALVVGGGLILTATVIEVAQVYKESTE